MASHHYKGKQLQDKANKLLWQNISKEQQIILNILMTYC